MTKKEKAAISPYSCLLVQSSEFHKVFRTRILRSESEEIIAAQLLPDQSLYKEAI